jgi:hypothetical protein
MYKAQQVLGPVASTQINPMQVSGPGSYYPQQTTTDPTSNMFSSMMPMIMMIMMFSMLMPMFKGIGGTTKE